MEQTIILATNNKNKLKEIREKLCSFGVNVISQSEAGYEIEVEETGTTFAQNATLKAKAIYNLCGMPVIADDSGLEIDALHGEPGVYSARYAGPNATDEEKIAKVLKLLEKVEDKSRTARFKCDICYIDTNGKQYIFEGVCEGKIARKPQGNNGFGYDPIFQYDTRTFAQMSKEEKNAISHRGRAVAELVKYLKKEHCSK